MSGIGIVIVSHSKNLAQGLYDLIEEVAKDVSVTYIGGTKDGEIGTSFEQIEEAIEQNAQTVLLTFFDLGSARMNLEIAADLSDKDIVMMNVPIVEGAYSAAALIQAGVSLEEILSQLEMLKINK
ncbi:dihydroxyacetone kinase phosphoryl donor subunit DhaM [Streptococcus macacae]|uniref:phosphoenolpyruvate--glycerone phosphotransferase n=1 Tax=Streptococcus macacae NCTC 11558 TaxID=764298 RepID=G5JVW0_9STRE|nr:dihydroxyacetone kinase phosphoryl donor subunit DhaM [Streptococcus macacae]EHJ52276.1 dihydroxyacetone kinase, phosphotransfer subunit [Streptococcus macacae NCTC 11558]SUN78951.1 Phosphoenolpyruvate-dihydroxyacetone phosphotransferase, subunit DhaM; DHA-specific IIA component [Streptococcus macacae NCTC 11558]